MHKFGREFSLAAMDNRDGCVNDRVCIHICQNFSHLIKDYFHHLGYEETNH